MHIISKHITHTGAISFHWIDEDGQEYITGIPKDQVKTFLRRNIIIKEEGDLVWVRYRNAFQQISHRQMGYMACLEIEIKRREFCQQIISSNILIK